MFNTYSLQPNVHTSSKGTNPISLGRAGEMFSYFTHRATLISSPL